MNKKICRLAKQVGERSAPLLISIVFLGLALLGVNYATQDIDTNVTDNFTENEPPLNQSKYYDTEDKVCRSPEINDTNASELEVCVSNQTSVS